MSKKYYRYYGGLLGTHANWLNKMAKKGYRLARTGKLFYEFEECRPKQYQYCVEFIGQKSKESAEDYADFLTDCGYRVFFKNINLNSNIGKVVFRPWAEQGGRLAMNSTTLNRELLIVEKANDGKAFDLHTTYEDKARYYRQMRRPWLYLFLVSAVLGILMRTWVWGIFGILSAVGLFVYQIELFRLNKQAKVKEW